MSTQTRPTFLGSRHSQVLVLLVCSLTLLSRAAVADVTAYTNKSAWQNTAGPYTTIAFTGFPPGTFLTTQYQSMGETFTDGSDQIFPSSSFPNDGFGLYGFSDEINIAFNHPMTSIAVDHPGNVEFWLYWQGRLTYVSPIMGGGGIGWFSGLVSTTPFDAVVIWDSDVFIDDLHFGAPVPAPAIGTPFVLAALFGTRKRRLA